MPKIDKAEVAESLGISPWTVGKFVREHRIPHYRVGRRVVFDVDEVEAWLIARRVEEERESSTTRPVVAKGRGSR